MHPSASTRLDTHRISNRLHGLADDASHLVDGLRDATLPTARRYASQAETLARHGVNVLHDHSAQLRARAGYAGERGLRYLRDEPYKPVLIAAVAAGALMALAQWLARRSLR